MISSGFLGFANVYAMRVNLSVAIVYMVNNTALNYNNNYTEINSIYKDGTFLWDESQQGIILGMFFYGYVLTQVPGGRLAEIVGGKWLMGVGVLITAIFTLLTPLAAITNIYLLYTVRIIEGLGEGLVQEKESESFSSLLSRCHIPSHLRDDFQVGSPTGEKQVNH